jgi:hypothetical protein
MYWYVTRFTSEATSWLAAALERADDAVPVAVRATARQQYALNLTTTSTIEDAVRAARESLRLWRSMEGCSGCARSTWTLAQVLRRADRREEAYRYACDALELADRAGDAQTRAWVLSTMSLVAPTVQDVLSVGSQAVATHRAAGNQREVAAVESGIAYTALRHGADSAADTHAREALEAARDYGDPWALALAHGNAGLAALFNNAPGAAQRAFVSELRLSVDYGFQSEYAPLLNEALSGLAAVAAAHGRDRTAATLSGAAEAATPEGNDPAIARRLDERFLAPARARLGERA